MGGENGVEGTSLTQLSDLGVESLAVHRGSLGRLLCVLDPHQQAVNLRELLHVRNFGYILRGLRGRLVAGRLEGDVNGFLLRGALLQRSMSPEGLSLGGMQLGLEVVHLRRGKGALAVFHTRTHLLPPLTHMLHHIIIFISCVFMVAACSRACERRSSSV